MTLKERLQAGGGGSMSRPRVPSPEELTRIQSFKEILDDLIRNILNSSYIAPGIAAVFAEAEHRPFLATQAAFDAAYPAVRDIYEPRFQYALGQRLPGITLYRLYRLYMHAVYCLKTPPDYNLLHYSNRRNDTYDTEVLAVIHPLQLAARVYFLRVENERMAALVRLRTAVHGARRPSTEALIKTHLTPAETAATAAYDLTYDVKLKEPTDTGEVCFPCDRLDDIDGTEVFIVGYKLPGKKDSKDSYKHYYDYAAIQREPMVRSRYMKHPLLTRENVWIDLQVVREKMAALVASQARQSGGRFRKPKTKRTASAG